MTFFVMQDAADMKGKLEKYEAELENARKSSEISLVSVPNFHSDSSLHDLYVLFLLLSTFVLINIFLIL